MLHKALVKLHEVKIHCKSYAYHMHIMQHMTSIDRIITREISTVEPPGYIVVEILAVA